MNFEPFEPQIQLLESRAKSFLEGSILPLTNGTFPVNVHAWSPVLKNAAGRRRYLPMSALVPLAFAAGAK